MLDRDIVGAGAGRGCAAKRWRIRRLRLVRMLRGLAARAAAFGAANVWRQMHRLDVAATEIDLDADRE
jgi:hypothetical protein